MELSTIKVKRDEQHQSKSVSERSKRSASGKKPSNVRQISTTEDDLDLLVQQDPLDDAKMSVGASPAEIGITVNNVEFTGILDTGSDHCHIPRHCLEQLDAASYAVSRQSVSITLAEEGIKRRPIVLLSISSLGKREKQRFGVLETSSNKLLLGREFMAKWNMEIPMLTTAEVDKLLSQYQVADLDELLEAERLKESSGIEYHKDHERLS
jgi:hypothetical protein